MKRLSIILPIHNGAGYLQRNVERLVELLSPETTAFQIIIVDDGSQDGSGDVAAELARRFPQVTAIYSAQHQGEKLAIERGLNQAWFTRKFILATERIEESKIRAFMSQEDRSHVDPEPEDGNSEPSHMFFSSAAPSVVTAQRPATVESLGPASPPPVEKLSTRHDSAAPVSVMTPATTNPQQRVNEPVEHHLVERLMKWGVALREYRRQLAAEQTGDPAEPAEETAILESEPEASNPEVIETTGETEALLSDPKQEPIAPPESRLDDHLDLAAIETPESCLVTNSVTVVDDLVELADEIESDIPAGVSRPAIDRPVLSDCGSIPERRLVRLSQHDLKRFALANA